jgi:hypothetical protein
MAYLDDFHSYDKVLVSGVDYDFSRRRLDNIPHKLYAEWAALLVNLAKIVFPEFVAPPFPETLVFQTESIPSDGPYSASADYYMLDYVFFEQKTENGDGLKIHFENGRWGGGEPVNMEISWRGKIIYSSIAREAKAPLASIYFAHPAEQTAEISEIIDRHREGCRSKFMKWKTKNGTFLIQNELKRIPFIYGGVGIEGGARFDYAAEYVETDVSGEIIKKYAEPYPFSIEDEMTVSHIHRVIGDCFYEFYYSQRFRFDPELKAELLFSELEFYEGILPFDETNLFLAETNSPD